MNSTTNNLAEQASFIAFANCYLREVDCGKWQTVHEWPIFSKLRIPEKISHIIEIDLKTAHAKLAVLVSYKSIVGRHQFSQTFILHSESSEWQAIDFFSTTLLLIKEIFHKKDEKLHQNTNPNELELIYRTAESNQLMACYLEEREKKGSLDAIDFIESEQSLLFGHWLHPTPKSRQGMPYWLQSTYSPELQGTFKLHYFAVDTSRIQQDSNLPQSSAEIIRSELQDSERDLLRANETPIPAHPLQAQWLLHQDYIKESIDHGLIRDLGPLGNEYTPTSSVRTVYRQESDWMFKFSIPVKITNSLRRNMHHELNAGMIVSKLLHKTDFLTTHPYFKTIVDPAYITVDFPERNESGFEVIIRENSFKSHQSSGIYSIAALTQDPLSKNGGTDHADSLLKSIIIKLSQKEKKSVNQVALSWMKQYWKCSVETLIYLYDRHGIALEAHQQNSLLDLSNGYPTKYYYRDNQGFYLSQSYRDLLEAIEPDLSKTKDLFYDDQSIRGRFTYYLFINQFFSVVHRFGADALISEAELLDHCRSWLMNLLPLMKGAGRSFIQEIIEKETLAYKANLLTRVQDIDELQADQELAVYATIANPFAQKRHASESKMPIEFA